MTVIYVDTLFLLNAVVDYLLLLCAARLAGEPLHRIRFGIGAVLGGLYAVALFLPGLMFLSHPLCRVASAAGMLLVAYGGSRRLLRQGIIFLALACAFGGGVVAISLMGGQGLTLGNRGVLYSPMDIKIVFLSAAVCYGVLSLVFRRVGRHTVQSGELLSLELALRGRQVKLMALVDTGNTLTDPASGRPVIVADGDSLKELFPRENRPVGEDLSDPASGLARLGRGDWKGRFRLLPYRCIGVECGLLLGVRVDQVRLNGVELGPYVVAMSPTPVSDGGGYRALVGALDGKDGVA
ncbi:sigma-E processing peptidase SpoIIGA [Flavonifractor sp. An100]|uniref:sigma-E processing peptidase SpoIIGA n=1 Tax=Flavonifractor sp. An100 TaxID=1965538 RepID=UPI000B388681|nr:sigma-E processing peptidase SpoIIGA [Flavonifractor sp. An100]OUQ80225.1 sigma-E processing peptidase SpoIIGA [Flavonifractor sp. An100]